MNRIIQIAINRPISVLMLTIALVLFGWRALQNLETALLPDIEYPEFFILTEFPGGSPAEIEKHITIPLEEVLVGCGSPIQLEHRFSIHVVANPGKN